MGAAGAGAWAVFPGSGRGQGLHSLQSAAISWTPEKRPVLPEASLPWQALSIKEAQRFLVHPKCERSAPGGHLPPTPQDQVAAGRGKVLHGVGRGAGQTLPFSYTSQ